MARNLDASVIPNGWKYDLLDKFAVRCSGHTPSKRHPEYWNGGVKWISLTDSHRLDKGYVYATDKEISLEGIANSSAEIHPSETVVLSRDAGIGKSGVMAEAMAVSQHFIAWKCDNKDKLNSWFLYNWLQLNKAEFERQAVGSTIKTIGLPYFKKLKIAVPPYSEQKKIARIFSVWDQAIFTAEQLLSNSQKQKKALIQKLLTGKGKFQENENEWGNHFLSELFDFKKGKGLSKGTLVSDGKKCILYGELYTKYSEVITDVVSRTAEDDGFTSKSGDILIPSSTTTTGIDLSNATVILEDQVLLGGDINVLRPKKKINSVFMAYLLTHIKKKDIASRAQGITIIHLYGSDLKTIKVFIPNSLTEQEKIVSVLLTADNNIDIFKQKLHHLKQEKKALMQQLLTGKRRVKTEAA
ncbi:restriction endonuclease subunit S [Pectobacterium polaris]|uniref:restriction endonuclease subunit S n=1 Tax=Pectobacterium polaris TaxID=2042057 RepID=UPI0023AEE526|nr:restriction endonuclease subunit S [Pectobacterium polaris]MDE8754062.1 restriction endonuclease subunit S [Pectobacterium polaris]